NTITAPTNLAQPPAAFFFSAGSPKLTFNGFSACASNSWPQNRHTFAAALTVSAHRGQTFSSLVVTPRPAIQPQVARLAEPGARGQSSAFLRPGLFQS